MHSAVPHIRTTTASSTTKKRSAPLDPKVADRLLELLSSDDEFRALFMSNPREALSEVGFVNETELASPHFCFWGISKLASKSDIAAARKEIRSMLTSGLSQITPNLDAGIGGHRKLR